MKTIFILAISFLFGMSLRAQTSFGKPVSINVEPVVPLPSLKISEYLRGSRAAPLIFIDCAPRRITYTFYSLQQVMVKIAGLSAERVSFKFSRHTDLLPKHDIMPLTHRTYQEKYPLRIDRFVFEHNL